LGVSFDHGELRYGNYCVDEKRFVIAALFCAFLENTSQNRAAISTRHPGTVYHGFAVALLFAANQTNGQDYALL